MHEEIKCPQCGGNKFKELENNIYKCMYCKTTFTPKSNSEPQPTMPANNPVYSQPAPPPQNFSGEPANARQPYQRTNPQPYRSVKSKTTAGLLAIFLGSIGIHHFYLRRTGLGILYILFCWTWITCFISFIEGIVYLCMSDKEFDRKYNNF